MISIIMIESSKNFLRYKSYNMSMVHIGHESSEHKRTIFTILTAAHDGCGVHVCCGQIDVPHTSSSGCWRGSLTAHPEFVSPVVIAPSKRVSFKTQSSLRCSLQSSSTVFSTAFLTRRTSVPMGTTCASLYRTK